MRKPHDNPRLIHSDYSFCIIVFQLVGSIASLFRVEELLEHVFAEQVNGIDVILTTHTHSLVYTIRNGVAEFVQENPTTQHQHHHKYQAQQQSIELIQQDLYYWSDDDIDNNTKTNEPQQSFQLMLIPNDDFYALYHTNNPALACVAAILSILVATIGFFVYDYLVRAEFQAKKDLLDARRQFMVRR
jgi:hypothetical protein